MMAPMLRMKRVYEAPSPDDGFRILVDRLWPRGLSKEKARIDLWMKDIAPSDALRRWAHSHEDEWPEFERRYLDELRASDGNLDVLREHARAGTVTLLYAKADERHNNAIVLFEYLTRKR